MNLLVCDDCGLQFTHKALISHQNHHHNKESFPCADCGKIFGAPTRLNAHQNQAHATDNCVTRNLATMQLSAIISGLPMEKKNVNASFVLIFFQQNMAILYSQDTARDPGYTTQSPGG